MSTNNVLAENVQGLWDEVESAHKESGEEKRLFKAFSYKAGSWDRERTVICKMEHTGIGMNRRFIVISGGVILTPKKLDSAARREIDGSGGGGTTTKNFSFFTFFSV